MKISSNQWKDFPDYILAITREIWEDRAIATLNHYYSQDILVRTPMGMSRGNKKVMSDTMATLHEFPDRQLFGEDVIWSGAAEAVYLSSHRIISTGTHSRDGMFGKASGQKFKIRILADCAAKDDTIFDEWLVRDYGGLVKQLGINPRKFAKKLIREEGGPAHCIPPFTPDIDIDGGYNSRGNDNEWGRQYARILSAMMANDFRIVEEEYDRAVQTEYAGAICGISPVDVTKFWLGIRSSFPNAKFKIHHQIGIEGNMLPPRAAIRWSLDGYHEGWGSFGKPTGANVHVMGICHAEFGPYGKNGPAIRREYALYDEVAIWKQILMQIS